MEDRDWRIDFRKCLAEYLERRGMSQKELAWRLRVSQAAVSSYLSGARIPSVTTLVNIAHILNCHVSDLVGVRDIE